MPTYNLQYNIKQLRHRQGWSQEDVAIKLDISIPAYSKIETGITDINLSRLEQIAILYKTTVAKILTGDNPEDFEELNRLKSLLLKLDQDVIDLQKQIIKLYKSLNF